MSKTSGKMEGTATYVRSRPKLPGPPSGVVGSGSPASDQSDMHDIVGVLTSLSNTDFVRKYSRKHRGSLSDTTSPPSSLPNSLPLSPSGIMSPVTGQRSGGITLTRMRSIRVKLEKVKEHQERVEAAQNKDATGTDNEQDYSCATLTRKNVKAQRGSVQSDAKITPTESSTHSNTPSQTYDDNSPAAEEVEGYTRLSRARKDTTGRKESTGSNRRTGTIEAPCLEQMSLEKDLTDSEDQIHKIGKLPPREDNCPLLASTGSTSNSRHTSGDKWTGSYSDSEARRRDNDKSPPHLETPRKTSGKMLCGQYAYKLDKHRYAGDKMNIEQGRTLFEPSDDESLSATDSDRNSCKGCIFPDDSKSSPNNSDSGEMAKKCTKHKTLHEGQPRRSSRPDVAVKLGSGRFLTHPPFRDRALSKELGSMDSNGLGSLRECSDGYSGLSELKSDESVISVDSNIGPSDTNDGPSYRDVVMDVTAEASGVEKSDRRNGKSLKYKSKSDPSGKKQKCIENVDMSKSMQAHAHSVPVFQSTKPSDGNADGPSSDDDKRKSKSDNVLDNNHLTTPHIQELRSSQLMRSTTSEESSEEYHPLPTLTPRRRSSKKKNVDTSDVSEEGSRSDVTGSPVQSNTAPSSPRSGNSGGALRRFQSTGINSLTLPTRKSSLLSRSHSSASVISRKAEAERNKTLPLRPKSRPKLPEKLALSGGSAYCPRLEPIFSGSSLSLLEGTSGDREKRDLIVEELVSTERLYVEALRMLVEKYMIPLKTQGILDSQLVDEMFYKVNELYMHHATFLAFLEKALGSWHPHATIGDVIHRNFSKQTVIESYVSFIEHFPRAEKVLHDLAAKTTFQRFVEQCERESSSKLPLKAQLVKPAQRIPRYELLLKRLLENTPKDHPDQIMLLKAEDALHHLALRINSVKESKHEEDMQETLKKLELLLITDLVSPERIYLRYDMLHVLSRKEQCCIWLFSDLAVFTAVKRKSGPVNRKSTLLLQSPTGNDFVENVKHKVWLKIPLDDLEISKELNLETKQELEDKELLESDFSSLTRIHDLTKKLNADHQNLEDCVTNLMGHVNKQLSEHQRKSPPPEANKVQLVATTLDGISNITLVFPTSEKKSQWETILLDAKRKLANLSDTQEPEFLQPLQITKTRAGMQFSCAASIDGLNAHQHRDVWVCNSDGYVGHVCLLSLQPEPIVTLNTPIPACNSRILCVCAVPAFSGVRRKGSVRRSLGSKSQPTDTIPRMSSTEDGYSSDSSSSSTDDEYNQRSQIMLRMKSSTSSFLSPKSPQATSPRDNNHLFPFNSTMWLGTEDGGIHIFQSIDNIKTTKNKVKLQPGAGVNCICHMEQKVFVALNNGDVLVYERDPDGMWNFEEFETLSLCSTYGIHRLLPVAGKLWCSAQSDVLVLNPNTLTVELSFGVGISGENKPVQCMVTSGLAVWMSQLGGATVQLYHATNFTHLMDINIAPTVAQKLQMTDDIIRQHKMACLKITSLLTCKDLLWIGTSAGVILNLPMPRVAATTNKGEFTSPIVTGVDHGHTGHVRFLTSLEMPTSNKNGSSGTNITVPTKHKSRRQSMTTHTLTMATKMLVISGGDGYENFSTNIRDQSIGKDDSTNHLLQWQQ